MKASQEQQKAAEAEDTTSSVSNNEASTSCELPSPKINRSTSETIYAQDGNVTYDHVASTVYSACTTCGTEDIPLLCKAIEVEGTKTSLKSVDTEDLKTSSEPVDEVNILKPSKAGKMITFSQLVNSEAGH
jgi:hypothetical protein